MSGGGSGKDEWVVRVVRDLPGRFHTDATALVMIFYQYSDWPTRGTLKWLDGTGFSKAVGPAARFDTFVEAYAATVLAKTIGLRTRHLQDYTGHLVVPACVLPNPDGE